VHKRGQEVGLKRLRFMDGFQAKAVVFVGFIDLKVSLQ